jgi:hypothetical protein
MNSDFQKAVDAGPDCPSLEELLANLQRDAQDRSRLQTEAHVTGCAHCQAEVAMFREFEAPDNRPAEQKSIDSIVSQLRRESPFKRESWWTRFLQVKVWAPALVAVAASMVLLTVNNGHHSPTISDMPEASPVRSLDVHGMNPNGDLASPPHDLQWTPVSGAARYRVTVLEVDQTELWSTTVSAPPVLLPASVAKQIVPLKTLQWMVEALDEKGAPMAKSSIHSFRLTTSK